MPNVIVSIGRNIKNQPMNSQAWDMFKALTKNIVYLRCPEIYFIGTGMGYYAGATEESFTIIGGLHEDANMSNMKRELAELAKDFGQECIAVTVADPTFVSAA